MNNKELALSTYDSLLSLEPNRAEAAYNQGVLYYLQKDYDNAIKAYSKAIKIDPSYAYALNDRGSCYRALEDYDNAIADYLEASKNDPQAFIFNNLASAYRKAGDKDQAIDFYTKAIHPMPIMKWHTTTEVRSILNLKTTIRHSKTLRKR